MHPQCLQSLYKVSLLCFLMPLSDICQMQFNGVCVMAQIWILCMLCAAKQESAASWGEAEQPGAMTKFDYIPGFPLACNVISCSVSNTARACFVTWFSWAASGYGPPAAYWCRLLFFVLTPVGLICQNLRHPRLLRLELCKSNKSRRIASRRQTASPSAVSIGVQQISIAFCWMYCFIGKIVKGWPRYDWPCWRHNGYVVVVRNLSWKVWQQQPLQTWFLAWIDLHIEYSMFPAQSASYERN